MTMADLRTVRIGDLGRVVTGKTPPSAQPELFGELHPFLTPTDIDGFARYIEPGRFLSPEGRSYQHRLMLPERAVCVVCIGATIGKVCMTGRPSFTNQQINSVVVNEAEHDPFFVYHLLTTLKDELKANAGGAATPIINKTAFSEIQVCVPPLPVQRRIAGILSAYDELIENSQRRVRLLEEMARAFYCEWFVHFRFPGHESVPRLPSALGDIPQGWEVKPLSALCSRMESGGTPKRKSPAYWADGSIDWFKTGELWDGFLFGSEEKITELGQRESNARIFEPGTILMAIYGSPTVGRLGIVTRPSSCNQAALGLVADKKQISQTFLYFVLLTLRAHFNGLAQGAAQQNISKEKVANAVALVPPPALVAAFDRLAEPTFNQIQILQRQVQNLRRTRDLLLPRLLSGQLNPICRLA
jgi:type I restriction enzyme S subunit